MLPGYPGCPRRSPCQSLPPSALWPPICFLLQSFAVTGCTAAGSLPPQVILSIALLQEACSPHPHQTPRSGSSQGYTASRTVNSAGILTATPVQA